MKKIAIQFLFVFGLLASLPALAMDLQQAKELGLVGEQVNGYLGLVKSNAEAEALVKQINTKRKAKYQQIAQKNGVDLAKVQELAGQKVIDKTPAGQYIRNSSGDWVKK